MKRGLLKLAAWVLAVPALCAAVIVGGAAPLYLLLPSAKTPPSAEAPAVAQKSRTPTPVSATASSASDAQAPAEEEASAADPQPTGAVADAEEPPVADLPAAVAAVPTPRPADANGAAAKPQTEEHRVASLTPPAPPRKIEATAPQLQQAEQRRVVVRQTVNLRASPRGRKIGTLDKGTEVVVGRCEGWCEISVGGAHGFVHSSFITGTATAQAERPPARPNRYAERRRIDGAARESEWLQQERRRVGRGGGAAEPDWLYAEEPAPLRRRPPPIEYYDPEYLDPYY